MRQPDEQQLRRALTAIAHPRTPGRIMSLLREKGPEALDSILEGLPASEQGRIEQQTNRLCERDVDVIFSGTARYPKRLADAPGAPPLLFVWGNEDLLDMAGVSMCGSRNVSPLGLKAAASCGSHVALQGMAVMSGYARGVDMETHLAALRMGGTTVIVLAEGIDHFRVKKSLPREHFTRERVVVVSQFPPTQPWTAGGAMTRNAVIVGLGLALVVVEAGEKGGTLGAGQHALRAGRPVLVLDFGTKTPPGNRILLEQGAIAVADPAQLKDVIARFASETRQREITHEWQPEQMTLG